MVRGQQDGVFAEKPENGGMPAMATAAHIMVRKVHLILCAGSMFACLLGRAAWITGACAPKIRWTFLTMMCAAVAIAASRRSPVSSAKTPSCWPRTITRPGCIGWAWSTAGMTAFYVFRAMFMTFFGEYRGSEHPHESPPVMLVPLVILAVLSLAGGYLFKVPEFLKPVLPAAEETENPVLMYISVAAGLAGIALAWLMYVAKPRLADSFAYAFKLPYQLIYNKYFVDEVYDAAVVKPVVAGSRWVLWKGVDSGLIDGSVNGIGARARDLGSVLRLLQSGSIRSYAAWVLFGSVLLMVAMGIAGGLR